MQQQAEEIAIIITMMIIIIMILNKHMKKLILLLTFFCVIPNFAKHHDVPQDVNEGTAGAGVLGGLIVGGVTAAAARSPYGLLAAPAGALIGVLIKRHRNKKRIERAEEHHYHPRKRMRRNYN